MHHDNYIELLLHYCKYVGALYFEHKNSSYMSENLTNIIIQARQQWGVKMLSNFIDSNKILGHVFLCHTY